MPSTPLKHCLLHQVHDASVESSALSVKSWISSFLMIIMIIMIIIFSYPPQIIHMRDQLHILRVVKNISPTLEKYFCRKYLQATEFSPDAGLTQQEENIQIRKINVNISLTDVVPLKKLSSIGWKLSQSKSKSKVQFQRTWTWSDSFLLCHQWSYQDIRLETQQVFQNLCLPCLPCLWH